MRLVPMIPLRGFDGHKAGFEFTSVKPIINQCRPSFEAFLIRYNEVYNTLLNLIQKSREMECPACNCEFSCTGWEDGGCPRCGNGYSFEENCTQDYSDCWTETHWERYRED